MINAGARRRDAVNNTLWRWNSSISRKVNKKNQYLFYFKKGGENKIERYESIVGGVADDTSGRSTTSYISKGNAPLPRVKTYFSI